MNTNWTTCKLRDIADVRVSNVDKKTSDAETPVKLCNYMDVYANDYVTQSIDFMAASASKSEIERFRLQAGDVIITKDSETPDDIGVPAVVSDSIDGLVCGYHLALIRPRNNAIDPIYLAKQLSSAPIARYFSLNASGSTRFGLPISVIEDARIPLASKPLQTKIANILFAVDQAIEQTEDLIAKQQRIKTGLMQDLLSRGIDEHGNLRSEQTHQFKDSPLGRIPVGWAVYPCTEVTELVTVGIVIRPAQYYVASGIPALRSANICEGGINKMDLVFISSRSNDQLAKSQLRSGDVVTVRTGYPGTSAVVSPEFSGANCIDVLISRPSERLRSEFLATWINSPFGKNQVLRKQGGLAQQHFNVGELRDLIIPLPSLEEQDAIISVLSASEARVSEESKLARKCHTIKRGLMQDLLAGKRRVAKP